MKTVFKFKHKVTGLYWTGNAATFTKDGVLFNTKESALNAINTNAHWQFNKIKTWIGDSELIEYAVVLQHQETHDPTTLSIKKQHANLFGSKYGYAFLESMNQVMTKYSNKTYTHAIEIDEGEFNTQRKLLKDMGYSARTFNKVNAWIWIEDDEILMNLRLMDGVKQEVNMSEFYKSEAKALAVGFIKNTKAAYY